MESIEISGKDLRKRKKCEMSTEITKGETLDFVIKRDDVGEGISMSVFWKKQGIDLISNLGESLEEEWTGAKKGFFYQMAACDINGDGEKEIIIAGGNKKDVLELRVLQVKKNCLKIINEVIRKANKLYDKQMALNYTTQEISPLTNNLKYDTLILILANA